MFLSRAVYLCLLVRLLIPGQLSAVDRLFLFPSGTSNLITVARADDLSQQGSISATSSAFAIFASLDRSKYYVVSRTAVDSVLVVDAQTLNVTKRIDFGAASSAAAMTPDGRYLLVAAGELRVVRTANDELVGAGIAVGGGPTDVVVNNASTRAYVLAGSGRFVQVIDLDTLTTIKTIEVPSATSIGLTTDDARLLVAFNKGLSQFRTTDLEPISTINLPSSFSFVNATIHPLPGVPQALVQSAGSGLSGTAQVFHLDQRTVKAVGDIGSTKLEHVQVVSAEKAYAIVASKLVKIDFTTPSPSVTPLDIGANSSGTALSPNRRALYLSSFTDSNTTIVDVTTDSVVRSAVAPFPPSGHGLIFDASTAPPSELIISGGNDQFAPPGTTLAVPLTVQLVAADGSPVSGAPVLFTSTSDSDIVVLTEQPSLTNERGIATAVVSLPQTPAAPVLPEGVQAAAISPEPVEQSPDVVEALGVTANASGVTPVAFTINVIRGRGLIKVSGDYQVAAPNSRFPEPFVLLATDENGAPLPPGSIVDYAAFLAGCSADLQPLDPNGFAIVECVAGSVAPGAGTSQGGTLSASMPEFQEQLGTLLNSAVFNFTISTGANQIRLLKVSGDDQSARSGEELPQPLVFRYEGGFGGVGIKGLGVRVRQISGPPAVITPRFLTTFGNNEAITVKFGPSAGRVGIEVVASSPNLPRVVFSLTATGGRAVTLETQGDGQSGRVGTQLTNPLRVQVINESGEREPFPVVQWTVLQGAATLVTSSDGTGATARVTFGDTPGPVRIRATAGDLQTTFNLTVTPPQPVSISTITGQNQTLTVGVLSEPLTVRVSEVNNQPAAQVSITFSGPPGVLLHPADGGTPGNSVVQVTGADGTAAVRAELLASAGLSQGNPSQFSNTVTITATAGESLSTAFLLNVVGRAPGFESAGVVNAASFEAGLVPGSLATIFGSGLSEGVTGTVFVGGDTSYQGTSVRVGGIPAPLVSITGGSNEQINIQVPFELSPGRATTVTVENNSSQTTVSGVSVFSSQPGIFGITLPGDVTVGAVLHADGRLVTPENPAVHEERLAMYLTGAGAINPPVQTGLPAPTSPSLSLMTLPVVVGVDNKGAEVLFSGYAPGFLGLYQINFAIPDTAECGLRPLNVRVGDVTSPRSAIQIQCP